MTRLEIIAIANFSVGLLQYRQSGALLYLELHLKLKADMQLRQWYSN